MPEIPSHIAELLEAAKQKEEQERQLKAEEAEQSRQNKVDKKVEKIYKDREQQIAKQEEIEEEERKERENAETRNKLKAQLADLDLAKQQSEEKLDDPDLSEDVKGLHRKILEQVSASQQDINDEIVRLASETSNVRQENLEFINQSSKEAAEVLSYKKNEFGKIAEYVEESRKLIAEAKETAEHVNLNEIVHQLYNRIVSGRSDTYGADRDIFVDLTQQSYHNINIPAELLNNPYGVKMIRDKIFEQFSRKKESYESYEKSDDPNRDVDPTTTSMRNMLSNGMRRSLKIKFREKKTTGYGFNDKEIEVWSGFSMRVGEKKEWLASEPSGMRFIPRMDYRLTDSFTEKQKAKIQEAVDNPDVPLNTLKEEFDYTFDEDALGKIMEDAKAENVEFDKAKAEEKRLESIKRIEQHIQRQQEKLEKAIGRQALSERANEYRKIRQLKDSLRNYNIDLNQTLGYEKTAQAELQKVLADTNFLGLVRDKASKRRLEEKILQYKNDEAKYRAKIAEIPADIAEQLSEKEKEIIEMIIDFDAYRYVLDEEGAKRARENPDQYISDYLYYQKTTDEEDKRNIPELRQSIHEAERDLDKLRQQAE